METDSNAASTFPLDAQIEAVLFARGEPVSRTELARLTDADSAAVSAALARLRNRLSGTGLALIETDEAASLATAASLAEVVRRAVKDGGEEPLTKAALETLSILLYYAPVAKTKIEYIRGVNSVFILRSLLIRGLIERIPNPADQRSYVYQPTADLLAHLGITRVDELPDYGTLAASLRSFAESSHEKTDDAE